MSDNCPDCGRETKYHAWARRPFTECAFCGWHTDGLYEPSQEDDDDRMWQVETEFFDVDDSPLAKHCP